MHQVQVSRHDPIVSALIDEIDIALADHYGFSKEELDSILNYDLKYRMGRDGNINS